MTVETHDITDATEQEIDELLGYERDKERWSPEHIRLYTKNRKRKGMSHREIEKRLRFHCDRNDIPFNEVRKDALWEAFHGFPRKAGAVTAASSTTTVGKKR